MNGNFNKPFLQGSKESKWEMLKKCSSPKASLNSAGKFFKLDFFWPEGDRVGVGSAGAQARAL